MPVDYLFVGVQTQFGAHLASGVNTHQTLRPTAAAGTGSGHVSATKRGRHLAQPQHRCAALWLLVAGRDPVSVQHFPQLKLKQSSHLH